eukprot:COSAG02_NODE_9672_length_2147_cov_1.667969_1_plen_699_part_10
MLEQPLRTCSTPADLSGYRVLNEWNVDLFRGELDIEVSCDVGYEGAAMATCTTTGPYELSGCQPIVCIEPSYTVGYTTVTNNLDLGAADFDVDVSCDAGYYGSAQAIACSSAGPFDLSGCSPIACTPPADTTGYAVSEYELSPTLGFSVNVLCVEHYGNAPTDASVTACSEHGQPYTLTGCPLNNACQAEEDDCQGANHICSSTGPGDHSCTCPVSSYGTATGVSTAELPAGCTACVAQSDCLISASECSSTLLGKLKCQPGGNPAGFYVDSDGSVTSCAAGSYNDAGEVSAAGCSACTSQNGCQDDTAECLMLPNMESTLACSPAGGREGFYVNSDGVATACPAGTYSAAGEDSTDSCDAIVCAAPSTTPGYRVTATANLDLSVGEVDVTATCAMGFYGSVVVTPCSVNGAEYTLSGCAAIVCAGRTSATPGYVVAAETNLDLSQPGGLAVEATCAEGYEGTAAAAECSSHMEVYRLAGCSPIVCTAPLDTTGYVQVVANLDLSVGTFAVDVSCANGYAGTAEATACTASGAYFLSGCSSIVCTTPSSTTGYMAPVETNLDLSVSAFHVWSTCAPGYSGTATAVSCTTSGEYTLTGCAPIVCTRPAFVRGYSNVQEANLDLSAGAFAVSAVCASGFQGVATATPCTSSGTEYGLTGCSPVICARPGDTTGYDSFVESNLDRSIHGFAVSVDCASGYEG